MSATEKLPQSSKLVAVRLHARRGSGGVPSNARVQALFDLRQREQKRDADAAALRQLVDHAVKQVQAVPGQVQAGIESVTAIAVDLGLAIARELIGEALAKGLVDPTPTVVRCLRDCVHGSDRADLVVRLHPLDFELVQSTLATMPDLQEEVALARFVADGTLARGAVRAETGAGRLKYDPRDVLERICDEVRREASQ